MFKELIKELWACGFSGKVLCVFVSLFAIGVVFVCVDTSTSKCYKSKGVVVDKSTDVMHLSPTYIKTGNIMIPVGGGTKRINTIVIKDVNGDFHNVNSDFISFLKIKIKDEITIYNTVGVLSGIVYSRKLNDK